MALALSPEQREAVLGLGKADERQLLLRVIEQNYLLINAFGGISGGGGGGGGAATIADGADVAEGAIADAVVAAGAAGTVSAKLRRISTDIASLGKGSANANVAQITASASAQDLAIARATRTGLTISNTDAAINVFVGPTGLTTGNGIMLKPGQSITVTWVGLWRVIAASGSPVVGIVDEYN